MRRAESQTVRDNVIFELGMAIGVLGRTRCFIVRERTAEPMHILTDLSGLAMAEYEPFSDGNDNAALGPASNEIRKAMATLGPRTRI